MLSQQKGIIEIRKNKMAFLSSQLHYRVLNNRKQPLQLLSTPSFNPIGKAKNQ
jgi:hypothetical protein